ncbi:Cytoplasmic tRNA export protein [Klebsormidium nitens]|uniref:Cytoplasmic tRNA export protein n=1 Tax=Klebsormidium nitens TaxID=105231 RepID=A0A1Y1HZL4_KLENI|nr:Cytoplasmic tRNA export protein [Klebsormidium nitens]|eukprot:GAQ83172.1 Cytoplasmic tRNA export protein [Klebsormidium nitens]
MNKLFGFLGRGAGIDLPYTIGEAYSTAWGSWTHSRGTKKEDGSPVSVFSLTATNAGDGRLAAARNGVKRLRTVRHPNVLSFLHSTEGEVTENGVTKPIIYVVTEAVMPLSEKVKELGLTGVQRDEYFAWGLFEIAKAVSFLNNDCKLVHANVCVASVVVTPTLDWKLHAFDVLSEYDAGTPASEGPGAAPMLPFEWLVGVQYKPVELTKADWPLIRRSPPWAIDAWGLGCLIQELFSAGPLRKTEDLRNTGSIPKALLPDYQRLLGAAPNRRLNPSKFVEGSEFLRNKLVETIQFMEVLNLKDSVEKDSFFRRLSGLAEQLPRQIVTKKLLPLVGAALEFGSGSSLALQPLLKMGSLLPQDEFNVKVLPTITKLFASQDRSIRVGLLQNFDAFGPHISASVMDEQVFPQIATGFADSSPFTRELTLKSMLTIVPKLSQRTLTGALLKHLSKLQVDEEPAIRTNTTILLGNIARHLNEATRKRVLINAFTRALRDQFPPARAAGLMALTATREYYDPTETATRILPSVVVLTIDGDKDSREKAFQCVETFLQSMRDHFARLANGDSGLPSRTTSASSDKSSGSALLGWAVGSLIGGKGSAAPAQTLEPPTSSAAATSSTASAGLASPVSPSPLTRSISTKVTPRQSMSGADVAPAASVAGGEDGWNNDEDEGGGEEDAEGWDDLDAVDEPAPPPPPARSQFQPRPPSASTSSAGSVRSPQPSDDADPWGESMAAPARPSSSAVSSSRPARTSATSASRPASARAPAAQTAQHVSLESMLGNSMTAGGPKPGMQQAKHVSLDSIKGAGRGGAMKLGAQRLNR